MPKTEQAAGENKELPAVKYMRELGYWSPPNYPRFKSPKRKKMMKKETKAPRKKRKCVKKLDFEKEQCTNTEVV